MFISTPFRIVGKKYKSLVFKRETCYNVAETVRKSILTADTANSIA